MVLVPLPFGSESSSERARVRGVDSPAKNSNESGHTQPRQTNSNLHYYPMDTIHFLLIYRTSSAIVAYPMSPCCHFPRRLNGVADLAPACKWINGLALVDFDIVD